MNFPKIILFLIPFLFSCKEKMIISSSSWFYQIDRFDEVTCPKGRRVSQHVGVGLVLKHEALNVKNIVKIIITGERGFKEVLTVDRFDKKSNRIFYFMRNKFSKAKHFESMSFRHNVLNLIVYPKPKVLKVLSNIKIETIEINGNREFFLVRSPDIDIHGQGVETFVSVKTGPNQYEITTEQSEGTKLIVEYKKDGSHFLEEKIITNKKIYVKIKSNIKYLAFQLIKDGIGFVTENKIEIFKKCEHF